VKMIYYVFMICLIVLAACGKGGDTLSSGTEIGNAFGVSGVIIEGGKPVKGARVKLLTVADIPIVLDTVLTNSEGKFEFELDSGQKISYLALKDSLTLFRGNVLAKEKWAQADTLEIQMGGQIKFILDEVASLVNKKIFIAGTGISQIITESQIIEGEWVLEFPIVPEIENAFFVYDEEKQEILSEKFNFFGGQKLTILNKIFWNNFELPTVSLVSFSVDLSSLWWAGASTILKLENGVVVETYHSSEQFNYKNCTEIILDDTGVPWLGTNKGDVGYISSPENMGVLPSTPMNSAIVSMAISTDLAKWYAIEDGGLFRYLDGDWDTLSTEFLMTQIESDFNGGVWATTGSRLFHFSKDLSLREVSGIDGDFIWDLAIGLNDTLWAVSDRRIIQVSELENLSYLAKTWKKIGVMKNIEINDNGIWLASRTNISTIRKGRVFTLDWAGKFRNTEIQMMKSDGGNSLWVVGKDGLYEIF
jgi:hypothetical protein